VGGAEDGTPTSRVRPEKTGRKLRQTVWFNQAVNTLVKAGHPLRDIGEYTLDQFLIFLDAVEQLDAASRANTTLDLTAAIGGMLGGGKSLTEHINSLSGRALGEKDGDR
jgi:hypothetical protein